MACYVTGILSLFENYFTQKLFTDTKSASKTECNLTLKVN